MKLPKFMPGKKLQATARARQVGPKGEVEEYTEEEPNMKFSSAFLVVLLLHVTAFGGIWAFNNIKSRRVAQDRPAATAAPQPQKMDKPAPVTAAPAVAKTETPSAPAASQKPVKQPEQATGTIRDSGTVYTVAKGDNPVTIAHHFSVSYEELLKLNNIENPKLLQIGQKLRIPAKK